ncbi:MAG: 2,4-dihydroxyacetophenone dioxygenase [Acidimicrobiaceae bacterium]|jgi:quercetin dioxygenase-like cupin family protein
MQQGNAEAFLETLAPEAIHRGFDELPFVDLGDGSSFQLLHVDEPVGLWIMRVRLDPGTTLPTHRHTGLVLAFTHAGRWRYREYTDESTAGSYLYEPAGSVHTLTVPADVAETTDITFVVFGANLNLTEDGAVGSVVDAASVLATYDYLCERQHGIRPRPVKSGTPASFDAPS